jgi:hypothetical protein
MVWCGVATEARRRRDALRGRSVNPEGDPGCFIERRGTRASGKLDGGFCYVLGVGGSVWPGSACPLPADSWYRRLGFAGLSSWIWLVCLGFARPEFLYFIDLGHCTLLWIRSQTKVWLTLLGCFVGLFPSKQLCFVVTPKVWLTRKEHGSSIGSASLLLDLFFCFTNVVVRWWHYRRSYLLLCYRPCRPLIGSSS